MLLKSGCKFFDAAFQEVEFSVPFPCTCIGVWLILPMKLSESDTMVSEDRPVEVMWLVPW